MLRNEPPFQALRLRRLGLVQGFETMAAVAAYCLGLRMHAMHASLEELLLCNVALDTAAAMAAFADACITLRLRKLLLFNSHVAPAALPELTRFIAAGALRELSIDNDALYDEEVVQVFDEAHESTRLFVAAVQASALTMLRLVNLGDLPANVVEAAAFINARK